MMSQSPARANNLCESRPCVSVPGWPAAHLPQANILCAGAFEWSAGQPWHWRTPVFETWLASPDATADEIGWKASPLHDSGGS